MAPELVRASSQYSRSVDIFAVGIIMFMLLSGGAHPLYNSKEFTTKIYRKALLDLEEFSVPEHLSDLAKNMFLRLTKFVIWMRYTAPEALKHPWITRKNNTGIP